MTGNKRFELAYEKGNWWAVRDGEITLWKEEVISLLNEQEQEISDLKKWLGTVPEMENTIKELKAENEQLKETIKELELENAKHIGDGEWDIRDITYGHGKFRLEEWGERYHQFYNGDKPLEDEEVVSLLFENEQLKHDYGQLQYEMSQIIKKYNELEKSNDRLVKSIVELQHELTDARNENEQLKKGIEIDNEVVKIIKKHLPIGFVGGLVDKQIENTVKSIVEELREEEDLE